MSHLGHCHSQGGAFRMGDSATKTKTQALRLGRENRELLDFKIAKPGMKQGRNFFWTLFHCFIGVSGIFLCSFFSAVLFFFFFSPSFSSQFFPLLFFLILFFMLFFSLFSCVFYFSLVLLTLPNSIITLLLHNRIICPTSLSFSYFIV